MNRMQTGRLSPCSRNAYVLTRPPPVRQDAPITSQKALAQANGTSREIDCEAIGGLGG
jgi:hypothetical protein